QINQVCGPEAQPTFHPIIASTDEIGEVLLELSSDADRSRRSMFELACEHMAAALRNAMRLDAEETQRDDLEGKLEASESIVIKLRGKAHRQSLRLAVSEEARAEGERLLAQEYNFGRLVGKSKELQKVFSLLEKLSRSNIPVLVEGESGTGKELIARAIHFHGTRNRGPFVSENCGALPDALGEAEFFGHEQGAYTGAIDASPGLLRLASGGTLFLDNLSELSLGLQSKLLRVLEEGEVRRVGGSEATPVDLRIIASTTTDLQTLLVEGRIREDFYYRLNGITLRLPPLRERREDIPLLVNHFLRDIAEREKAEPIGVDPHAMRVLIAHDWPGNVRQLKNAVENAALVAGGDDILPEHLPDDHGGSEAREVGLKGFREARDDFEKRYIETMIREAEGNVAKASRQAGLSRESFYRLLRKHAIEVRSQT
ncbi:MAG: sigma-54 dependent transcriptional regulator, partial [Planctomycetota bacterium]